MLADLLSFIEGCRPWGNNKDMRFLTRHLRIAEYTAWALFLHHAHLFLLFLALAEEFYLGRVRFFGFLVRVILILYFYSLYKKTLQNLLYTFWSFTFFCAIFFAIGVVQNSLGEIRPELLVFYSLGLALLMVEAYIMGSPIYFPRVRWWEYDFRYRGDLKIEVIHADRPFQGRLMDVRRSAGGLILFEEFELKDKLLIKVVLPDREVRLPARIFSKREPVVGRGVHYGVGFELESPFEKRTYALLRKFWKNHFSMRLKLKYAS